MQGNDDDRATTRPKKVRTLIRNLRTSCHRLWFLRLLREIPRFIRGPKCHSSRRKLEVSEWTTECRVPLIRSLRNYHHCMGRYLEEEKKHPQRESLKSALEILRCRATEEKEKSERRDSAVGHRGLPLSSFMPSLTFRFHLPLPLYTMSTQQQPTISSTISFFLHPSQSSSPVVFLQIAKKKGKILLRPEDLNFDPSSHVHRQTSKRKDSTFFAEKQKTKYETTRLPSLCVHIHLSLFPHLVGNKWQSRGQSRSGFYDSCYSWSREISGVSVILVISPLGFPLSVLCGCRFARLL